MDQITSGGFQEKGNALSGKCRRSFVLRIERTSSSGRRRSSADAIRDGERLRGLNPHAASVQGFHGLLDELHGLFVRGFLRLLQAAERADARAIDGMRTQILGLAELDPHHDVARRVTLRGERLASCGGMRPKRALAPADSETAPSAVVFGLLAIQRRPHHESRALSPLS